VTKNTSKKRKPDLIHERGSTAGDVLGQYLSGIGAYDLLTADQEVELAQTMEAGIEARERLESGEKLDDAERALLEIKVREGEAARRRFVESNLRLVVSNARRYAGGDIEMLDLIQEGNLGLITAVEKFDWRRGFKFSTYATWWIRQAMQRARVNLADTIRLPAKVHDILPAVRGAAEALRSKLGRAATAEEISAETGVPEADVEKALQVHSTVALETPIGEDGATLGDFVADVTSLDPDSEVEQRLAGEVLQEGLATLAPLHRRVIELRFGLEDGAPATLALISSEIDVPEHQLRDLIDEALDALQEAIASNEDLLVA
jgi:RNA polymerase sigma factor (sigma-70 family)